jgi:hypothetical protein
VLVAIAGILPAVVQAAELQVIEAEKSWLVPGDKLKITDDPQASGGKYVAIPEGQEGLLLVATVLQKPEPGRYHGVLRFRQDKLDPIGRCFSVRMVELADTPGAQFQPVSVANAYGWRFPDYHGEWADFPFDFEITDFPKQVDVNLFRNDSGHNWSETTPASGTAPAGAIDCVKISPVPDPAPRVRVVRVWPNKICYRPGEQATVTVTLQNTTDAAQSGEARCAAYGELTDTEEIGKQAFSLKPRERLEVALPWKPGRLQYGLEVRAEAWSGADKLDENREYCQVQADAQRVAVEGAVDMAYRHDTAQFLQQLPLSSRSVAAMVSWMRRDYCNKAEASSCYAPGAGFDQYDTRGAWMSYGGGWYRGFRDTILAVGREMAKQGILWTPYFDGYSWATKMEYWLERKPEWFLYDSLTGDVLGSYDTYQLWKHKQAGTYGLDVTDIGTFNGVPNYSREDTVDYAAQQVIEANKIFHFPGVRWDFHVTVWPGYADWQGKIVARDYPQADQISAKMLQRFKDQINKAIPGFYWGYNAGSLEDIKNYPLTNEVRDRGGGYILDECIYAACDTSNPYRMWPAYLQYNADLQEWHRQRGGYFNPYSPTRLGSPYAVDRIYDTVLRGCTGSYVQSAYYDSSLRFGNYPQFLTRYSALLYAQDRSRFPDAAKWLEVKSARPVWWENVVYQRQRSAKERQLIVNLINPPANAGINELPHDQFPPPAKDVAVTLKEQEGWKVARAWLVMFESADENSAPRPQHMALDLQRQGASVTVRAPCVFHWKLVVFEMTPAGGGG